MEPGERLHNEKLHNLYALQNIIKIMKSKRVRWADHAACMGKMGISYKIYYNIS
jgi:hypothetical protein